MIYIMLTSIEFAKGNMTEEERAVLYLAIESLKESIPVNLTSPIGNTIQIIFKDATIYDISFYEIIALITGYFVKKVKRIGSKISEFSSTICNKIRGEKK
jgi:transcriptional regulator of NAD metabolism